MSPIVIPLRHPQANPVENIDPPCDVEAPIEFPEIPSSPTGRLSKAAPRLQELRERANSNSQMLNLDLSSAEERIMAYYGMTSSKPKKRSLIQKFIDFCNWYGVARRLDKQHRSNRALLYAIGMSDRTRMSDSDRWLLSRLDEE
jgi:hypothetical protein